VKQTTIEIPDYCDIVKVLGPKDKHLNIIKKNTPCKIGLQQDRIISIFGENEEVLRVEKVFQKMIEVVTANDKLISDDVELFLRQSENGTIFFSKNDSNLIFQMGKRKVRAKSQKQMDYVHSIENNIVTFALGCAGTAKTYLATVCALRALQRKEIDKIVLSRPNVAMDNLHSGFLPGTQDDKIKPYLMPIYNVFSEFMSDERVQELTDKGIIQALPLEFLRGYSLKDTFVIVDEAQNLKVSSFFSILTRLGPNCKMVIAGDTKQNDLGASSGLEQAANIMHGADGVSIMRFGLEDVVRSGLTLETIKRFTEAGIV